MGLELSPKLTQNQNFFCGEEVSEIENTGLLCIKVPYFYGKTSELSIKEVRCFHFPKRLQAQKKYHTDCEGTSPPKKRKNKTSQKKKAGNASEENEKTKIVLHMAFKSTMMQNEKDYFLLKCQTFYHKTMCQPSIFLRKSLNLHHQAHGFRLISAIHHTFNYKVY